eukprot:TRINITY_DN2714_c0_g1_i1.p1 TRINITY_DN2714_c0_g1~~TRINITY_DN2714_c0_g1_i1.p1  ORF type:complete len:472 (-),score=161.06 TRINITY_DN2714_c0_g1_i1:125-1540(-)
MGDKSFSIDMWDGINAVYTRFDDGKRTLGEFIDMFTARQKLEEHYAKDLQKMCSKPAASAEGRTFGAGYSKLKEDNETNTRIRYNFAAALQKDFVTELKTLQSDQNKARATLQAKVQALQAELDKKGKALSKAKSAFHSRSEAAESALSQYEKAKQDPTCQPKQLSKLNASQQKLRKEADGADQQYNAIVQDHQQFQMTFETQMKEVLTEFQRMEESRLAFLKSMMEKFHQLCKSTYDELQKSTEELSTAVSQMDGNADVQGWISENQTDKQPPPPVEYVPYKQQYSHPSSGTSSTSSNVTARPVSQRSPATRATPAASSGPSAAAAPAPAKTAKSSTPAAAVTGKKAIAQYEYEAADETELGFKVGDVIQVTKMDDSGWWEGTCQGRHGMFPANYCTLQTAGAGKAPPVAALPPARKCRVLYQFNAQNADELTIQPGEIITIDGENEGWFTGTNARGKSGMFPANFTEEI